ncbi:gluconate 2-dehydrogenase subunit 3 family protein [Azospirillum sp. B506]|uniref:gluconate 2-dehydrogenase subunit 3 family protein n=1 Tax=Azospirillum sp. B506 TaxID=137721 RepID=UPI000345D15E|nr:gluconate 2-dehydrogenase subunit 3 family protein [Azospirillum sp. B506]
MIPIVWKDSEYVLNHCARSLARDNSDGRHSYGQFEVGDARAAIAEAWRFPIIDSFRDSSADRGAGLNLVTFVCINRAAALGRSLGVIGSFASLVEPIALQQVKDSDYWAVSVAIPKGEVHYYRYLAGGRTLVDPINPQRTRRPDGSEWSRFFTDYCTSLVVLAPWEFQLLERLTEHILPFRTTEAQRWLNSYYQSLDKSGREAQFARAFRLEQSVGAASFIDKLLARQEQHRLVDYRICLALCYQVLQRWNRGKDPLKLPLDDYRQLYEQLANDTPGAIAGWDYGQYSSPRFFLQLLRRHAFTGAFSHPKHGGNIGAAGWQFLASNLTDPATNALPRLQLAAAPAPYFDWARAHEPPLGRSSEYHG